MTFPVNRKPKTLIKIILEKFVRPILIRYLASDRKYSYRNTHVIVKAGVFHPGLFFSTKLMVNFIETIDLTGKKFLEVGAGTGFISVFAARRQARATALDISQQAILNIGLNAQLNQVPITIVKSDLFTNLPPQTFDIIVITPPYYPRKPTTESELAWFCGEEFEFYEKLFAQLEGYMNDFSKVLMILSEDCQIGRIREIAAKNNFRMEVIFRKRVFWEWNYIFEIRLIPPTSSNTASN